MDVSSYTIGYAHSVKLENGTSIKRVTNLEQLQTIIEENKRTNPQSIKDYLPGIFVYNGVKGTYTPSNIFFMDIDTTEGVDFLIENRDILFLNCPNILFIQKSPNGKLHIVGTMYNLVEKEADYKHYSMLYSVRVLHWINHISQTERSQPLNYLDIKDDSGRDAFDKHNVKPKQGLYLPHKPIYYNTKHFDIGIKDNIDELIDICSRYKIKVTITIDDTTYTSCVYDNKTYTTNTTNTKYKHNGNIPHRYADVEYNINDYLHAKKRVRLNKDYYVCGLSGYELRYQVMSELVKMFGLDGAIDVCKCNIVNHREVISTLRRTEDGLKPMDGDFPNIRDWIIHTFGKHDEDALDYVQTIRLSENEYMSDVKDTILELTKQYNKIQIVAPTGAGKTRLINGEGRYSDYVGLAHELNAIVTVPYIVTNALYNNLNIVTSERGEYIEGEPNVMVWDQVLAKNIDLTNRWIIIDESHTLFTEREFRDSAVQLMKRLKETNCNIISVSATPTGELEELGLAAFRFTKPRNNYINLIAKVLWAGNKNQASPWDKILKDIKEAFQYKRYDNIILFSDLFHEVINNKLFLDGLEKEVTWLKSENKITEDFKYIQREELLCKPITISTRIAYNGLNFNNEGKILIIMYFKTGETLSSELIQALGRFRKASDIDAHVYLNLIHPQKTPVAELADKANMFKGAGFDSKELSYNERLTNPDNKEAMTSVERYVAKNAVWGKVKRDLEDTGYIYVTEENVEERKDVPIEKPFKDMADSIWRGYIENDTARLESAYDMEEDFYYLLQSKNIKGKEQVLRYLVGWSRWLERIRKEYPMLNRMLILDWFRNQPKENRIETLFKNFSEVLSICVQTNEEFEFYVKRLNDLKKQCEKADKWFGKDVKAKIKRVKNIRNTYNNFNDNFVYSEGGNKGCIIDVENSFDAMFGIEAFLRESVYSKMSLYKENKAKAGSVGGTKGGSKKGKQNNKKGVEVNYNGEQHFFSSRTEADEYLKSVGLSQREIKELKLNKNKYKIL